MELVQSWLKRYLEVAAEQSAALREQYGLRHDDHTNPTGRYGAAMWTSETAFIHVSADVWEDSFSVRVGVSEDGLPGGFDSWLPVDVTCVAMNLEGPSVLTSPSRQDQDSYCPEWLHRQVRMAETHLGPVLAGDRTFAERARLAKNAYYSRPMWRRLLGR